MARKLIDLFSVLSILLFAVSAIPNDTRKFTAARKAAHLRRRGLDFEPSRDGHVLLFEDESQIEAAARVAFIPKYPTLVLDDVHDHVKDVTCSTDSMTVHFHGEEAMNAAASSWSVESEMVFFSSHTTCATEGEHRAYMVEYASFDSSARAISFTATKQTMKEATHRIAVDLGNHVLNDLEPKRELKMVRRIAQTASSTEASNVPSTTSSNGQTASIPPTVTFNFAPPPSTATVTATAMTKNVDFTAINQTVLPPDPTIEEIFPGTKALDGIQFGCRNCSMAGLVSLEAAGFEVNSNELEEIVDFLDNGYFQFNTTGLSAHIELELDLLPGFHINLFTANVTSIPLIPISIPHVINLGPKIDITIPIGFTLNSPVNFTTGFALTIPDNSQIILNVSDISGSSQTGFDQTKFDILPFSANTDDLSFNLTAGLKPKLTISAGVGDTSLGIGVNGGTGVFLDLPKMVAEISLLKNVNDNCNGPSASGTTNRAVQILPSATFDLGLHWELAVEVATVDFARGGEQVLASKTFDLPSSCLVFDPKSSSLVPANATSTGSNSNSNSNSHSGAAALDLGTVSSCAALIVALAAGFIML